MRLVRVLEQAAEEAVEAAAWYEQQRPGLGERFGEAVEAALDMLAEQIIPLTKSSQAIGTQRLKRLCFKRFPYDIIVLERSEELVVVAVAHRSRRPGYWKERLSG